MPKFLPDVCRFFRSLPVHRRLVDEHLFISPVQGGADYSDPLVFGRLPEKPAHIEQIVFKGGSRRRGQQIIFRADCAIADSNRRYVRIRFHLRPVFLERVSESPGRRPSRTSPSIQAALSDSHIDYFCPRGADFREEGVLRSKARAARSPSPARGRRPLATSRACSFPLAAVPLSRLASAVSIARNVQSTSRFLIVGPTQNAEAPAVGCGGRFGRKLSGESCLLVARLRWGRDQPACGGFSPGERNRRASRGRFNLCGDAVARTDR